MMKFPKQLIYMFVTICLMMLLVQYTSSSGTPFPSADREQFVGTWNGKDGCEGMPNVDDQINIEKGSNDVEFKIKIHASISTPDDVTGTLTENNVITVPEQSMRGSPGTAKITYLEDDTLEYSKSGFGITCNGTGYTKAMQ